MNPGDLIRAFLDFFKGQPFSNVVAFLQLGMIGVALWVGMFQLVPSERAAILEGVKHQEEQQTQQVIRLSESFDKALDRMDRREVAGGSKK